MIFEEIIKDIVDNVEGCLTGIMMGIDGVMVESYKKSEEFEDITTMSIEFTNILREIRASSEQLKVGNVEELTIKSDSMIFLIKMINEEYFVAIVLKPQGNYGKARYLIRKSVPAFKSEL